MHDPKLNQAATVPNVGTYVRCQAIRPLTDRWGDGSLATLTYTSTQWASAVAVSKYLNTMLDPKTIQAATVPIVGTYFGCHAIRPLD